MPDNNLCQYDHDFAHAMALKLRLHREARSRCADLVKRHGEFQLGIAKKPAKITQA